MHMHIWNGISCRAQQFEIRLTCVVGMNTALHADLNGTAIPGFAYPSRHFLECEVIRRAAQMDRCLSLRKRAKPALVGTDVSIVDVAVDQIAHCIAADRAAKNIGRLTDRIEIGAARREEEGDSFFG